MLKPGSLMGGGPEKTPAQLNEQEKNLHLQAEICLSSGRYSDALLLFLGLQGKGHPATFFNLALCHARGQAWGDAQQYLEKALTALKPLPEKPEPKGGVFAALTAFEDKDNSYATVMPIGLVTWPQLVRIRILRLLIDVYAASGQWNEVLKLAPALEGARYSNVEAAVAQARAKKEA